MLRESNLRGAEQAAIRTEDRPSELGRRLEHMWLSLLRTGWTTLAVIPADPTVDVRECIGSLVGLVRTHGFDAVVVRDAVGATVEEAIETTLELAGARGSGKRIVVGVDSPLESAAAASVALRADRLVLAARYRSTALRSAKAVVEMLGRERFAGCVVLPGRR